MLFRLKDVQLSHVKKCKMAKEVWDTRTKIYETSHAQTKVYYNKQLYTLKMSEDDTIANRANTFHTLIDNLASMGTNMSDNDSATAFLGSLRKFFKVLVVSISGQSNFILEGVTNLLLA